MGSLDTTYDAGAELGRQLGWVRRVASSLVAGRDAADDLAQETVAAAMESPAPDPGALRPWLRGIARNLFRMQARGHARRRRLHERAGAESAACDRAVPSPQELAEAAEVYRLLADAIARLDEPYRSTLLLRYHHDLSSSQIAAHQGVAAATVRWRLQVALGALRRSLDDRADGGREGWRRALLPSAAAARARRATPAAARTAAGWAPLATGVALVLLAVGGMAWRRTDAGRAAGPRLAGLGPSAAAVARGGDPRLGRAGRELAAAPAAFAPEALTAASAAAAPGVAIDRAGAPARAAGGGPDAAPCPAPFAGVSLGPELGADRPRLIVTRADLCRARAALASPRSLQREIHDALAPRLLAHDVELFRVGRRLNYGRAHFAQTAAFFYLLTGDRRFARQAAAALDELFEAPEPPHELLDQGSGLARATLGLAAALAYDWAWNGLDPGARERLEERLAAAVEAWPSFRHGSLRPPYASAWVAACRAAELVQRLALADAAAPAERTAAASRRAQLVAELRSHLEAGYGPEGLGEEGLSGASFAGLFLVPAARALRAVADPSLEEALATRTFWRSAMFASPGPDAPPAAPGGERVGAYGPIDYGAWTAALLGTVPASGRGVYQHFFDRHIGRGRAGWATSPYFVRHAGPVWAMLDHHGDVPPRDPAPVLGTALADETRGVYLFRNRWHDDHDVQVALIGHFRPSTPGQWDGLSPFQLGLRAFGAAFALGPGQKERGRGRSGLLVDGRRPPRTRAGDTAVRRFFEPGPRGGYVVVGGGTKHARLGLAGSERHLLVDFPNGDRDGGGSAAGPVLLATLDRLQSSSDHAYEWRLDLGEARLRAAPGSESGRPTFTVRGPDADGAFLKGWVLAPASARVAGGGAVSVEARGSTSDLWIVMATGTGPAPAAEIAGEGLGAVASIGAAQVGFDAGTGRLVLRRR